MSESSTEYTEAHFIGQEIIWGEGYMSPGGDEAVGEIVEGLDIDGKRVLEVGSGLGGSALALAANHNPRSVVGIDIQKEQVERARELACRRGLSDRVEFRIVSPGPLPFEEASFDIVFSKEALVQIPDKSEIFAESLRVLCPGGEFAFSDFVRARSGPLTERMLEHREKSGLALHWAAIDEVCQALSDVGFGDLTVRDRREWMVDQIKSDLKGLESGQLREKLVEEFDEETVDGRWAVSWRRMLTMAETGEQITALFRAKKPS